MVTTLLLRGILHKPELSGRLAKWAIELCEHNITYQTWTSIKSQVRANFIADFGAEIFPEVEQEALRASAHFDLWVLDTNSTSNALVSGRELVLKFLRAK